MYKIKIGSIKKATYESKDMFEKWWSKHISYWNRFYDITAFEFRDNKWVEIRKVLKNEQ